MQTNDILQVDLDKVIADKNPRLARLLPRFLKSYLKRIIHQDEINHVLRSFSHQTPVEFIRSTLSYMEISYRAVGLEQLPMQGRYLFVSNHPFGGMDGMMLCDELDKRFGSGRIIVNDILMNLKPLAPLFIPINKHGRQNSEYLRFFRDALASDDQIATFPAGLCSRRIEGKICDTKWKHSFVKNAIESQRDIVPVFFEGRLSNFFYNLSSFRKKIGIKANIEMIYLPDEMFSQKGRHFDIHFGKPIPWQELAASTSVSRTAQQIREMVYALHTTQINCVSSVETQT